MNEFWSSLDSFEKILWAIAVSSSVVFVIQSVLTFTGMDSQGGFDVDSDSSAGDHSPFQLFTLRNLINFLLGFSWMGISVYKNIESKSLVVFLSALVGLALVTAVMMIFYFMSKLEQSGNIGMTDTLGCSGTVYIPLKSNRTNVGKVQISVKGAIREYDAVSDEALKTGEPVTVKSIEGSILLVERRI